MTTSNKPTTRDTISATFLLIVGAISVAFLPSTAKLAFEAGSNTITVIFIRALTGATLLGVYLAATSGKFRIPKPLIAAAICVTVVVILMVHISSKVGVVTTNFHMSFWTFILFACLPVSFQDVKWPQTSLGWISSVGNGIAHLVSFLAFLLAAALIGALEHRCSLLWSQLQPYCLPQHCSMRD